MSKADKPTYEELIKALGFAIDVYQYASMTSWERECYEEEMKFAEEIYNRVPKELKP